MYKQSGTWFFVVAIALAVPAFAYAQAADAVKVGVVNVGRLLQESPQAQAAREKLERETNALEHDYNALQKEIGVLKAKLAGKE